MNTVLRVLCCSLFFSALACLCRAEDSGLSQKSYDERGLQSVFTFRDGFLIHEITIFFDAEKKTPENWFDRIYLHRVFEPVTRYFDPATGKRRSWVERFYAESLPVFVRTGTFDDTVPPLRASAARLSSESYMAGSPAWVSQGTLDRRSYPQILHVGREAFTMGDDGFYHVEEMRDAVSKSSVIFNGEFFTRGLVQERGKYLAQPK